MKSSSPAASTRVTSSALVGDHIRTRSPSTRVVAWEPKSAQPFGTYEKLSGVADCSSVVVGAPAGVLGEPLVGSAVAAQPARQIASIVATALRATMPWLGCGMGPILPPALCGRTAANAVGRCACPSAAASAHFAAPRGSQQGPPALGQSAVSIAERSRPYAAGSK